MNSDNIEYQVSVEERIVRVEVNGGIYQHRQVHTWIGNKASWWQRLRAKHMERKLGRSYNKGCWCATKGRSLANNPYSIGTVDHDQFILGFISVKEAQKAELKIAK